MAITRIKNNQITDGTIQGSAKVVANSITAGLLEDNLTYGSNLTVSGDLTVSGTTTTLNTTNTTVEDPIMVLGSAQTGAGALDLGFIGERGSDQNIFFGWDEASDEFIAGFTSSADSSTVVAVTAAANLRANNITVDGTLTTGAGTTATLADLVATGTSNLQGAVDADSTMNVDGNTTLSTVTATGTATMADGTFSGTLAANGGLTATTVNATGAVDLDTTLNVDGQSTLASVQITDLTDNQVVIAGTAGELEGDANFTFDGTNLKVGPTFDIVAASGNTTVATLTAGESTLSSATVSDLTATRVTFAGTAGALEDSANMTFDGTTLTSNALAVTNNGTVGGTLAVTGNTTLNSNVTVVGGVGENFIINDGTTTKFSVDSTNGNTAIAGTATVTGTMDVTGESTLASATVSDLTDNRLVIAGTAGSLEDDANLTFDGVTFEVGTGFDVIAANGNTAIAGTLTVSGATDLNGALTAGDITLDATSTFDAGANKLTNLLDPTLDQDAATKAYVDSIATGGFTLTDGTTPQVIGAGDTLLLQGTTNEVNVAVSATDTMTIGLPDDVTITNDLTVTAATSTATLQVDTTSNFDGTITADNIDMVGDINITGDYKNGSMIISGTGIESTVGNTTITIDPFPAAGDAGGDVIIYGNLQITGTQTTVNSTTVTVADPIGSFGTNTVLDLLDRGIVMPYHDGVAKEAFMGYDNSADEFIFVEDATNTANVISGSTSAVAMGSARVEDLTDTRIVFVGDTNGELADSANLTFDGTTLTAGGLTTAGALSAGATTLGATTTTTLGTSGLATLESATVTNATQLNGTLGVTGIATMDSLANLNGGIAVDGTNFTVDGTTGAVSTTSTLDVTGASTFTGDMSAGNIDSTTLDTTGNVTIGGTLDVTGNSTVNADFTMIGGAGEIFTVNDGSTTTFSVDSVTGDTFVNGSLTANGTTSLSGNNVLNGFTVTNAPVTAGGFITGATYTITATGTTDFTLIGAADSLPGTTFTATGPGTGTGTASLVVDMGSNRIINVADPVSAQDAASKAYVDSVTSSGFTITDGSGSTTISGGDTLTVSGTANEVTVVTDANADTMVVGLATNVDIAGTFDVTGATTLDSTLAVTGVSTLTGVLNANGGIAVDGTNFTVDGTTGAVSTTSTLDVTGASTLSSTLDVTGDTTMTTASTSGLATLNSASVSTTLGVTGASTLSTTGVTGVLTVNGSAVVDNLTIDGSGIEASTGTEIVINDLGADINFRVEGNADANVLFVDAGTDSVNVGTATAVTDVSFQVGTTDAAMMPVGTTAQRPAVGVAGMMRYNSTTTEYEYYDGGTSSWASFGTEFTLIASETFAGDDTTTVFTLASAQTTESCIVSINGVVQQPTSAYGVSNTTLTFTAAPATGDTIEVRELTTTTSIANLSNGTAIIEASGSNLDVTGSLIPTADVTYDLGSATNQWKDLYLSGSTIHLGGLLIKNDGGTIKFLEANGTTPATLDLGTTLDPDVSITGGTY